MVSQAWATSSIGTKAAVGSAPQGLDTQVNTGQADICRVSVTLYTDHSDPLPGETASNLSSPVYSNLGWFPKPLLSYPLTPTPLPPPSTSYPISPFPARPVPLEPLVAQSQISFPHLPGSSLLFPQLRWSGLQPPKSPA